MADRYWFLSPSKTSAEEGAYKWMTFSEIKQSGALGQTNMTESAFRDQYKKATEPATGAVAPAGMRRIGVPLAIKAFAPGGGGGGGSDPQVLYNVRHPSLDYGPTPIPPTPSIGAALKIQKLYPAGVLTGKLK